MMHKKESTQKIAHVYSEASRLGALGDGPIMRWTILLPQKKVVNSPAKAKKCWLYVIP